MVCGSQDRSSYGADGLFCPAPGSQTMELSLQITSLGADGGPGILDERGLQPGCPFAHARGAAFASALVVLWAQAGPGDQMSLAREAAHIGADFADDDLGTELADARNGAQDLDRRAKGLDVGLDLLVNSGNGLVEGGHVVQMQPQHEPVMRGH